MSDVDFQRVALGDIACLEMGQSPDSRYVVDDPFVGYPFLQGNAEFGAVSPEPKFGCTKPAKMCKVGDVLISVRAPVGAVNLANRDYCIGRGLAAIRAPNIKPSLMAELIARQSSELRRVAQGTTFEAINKKDLESLILSLPPKDDLPVVAKILDTLDIVITQTEAIIAKLKVVRQGLLNDLLTRGIDGNGELRPPQNEVPQLYKPSALGWIPREWDAAKFAEVGEVILGRQSAPKYRQGRNMRPYLRVVNIADDRLDLRDVKIMNFDSSDFSRFRLQYGDVLLTEGDLASAYTVGRSAVYRGEIEGCCFQNTLLRFRPNHPQHADFFHYAFCHLRVTGRFAVATTATTVHHLSAGRLEREVVLPVAPPDEMEGIARRLTIIETRIDAESDNLRKRKEQKRGLVNDLLTGNVRVTALVE